MRDALALARQKMLPLKTALGKVHTQLFFFTRHIAIHHAFSCVAPKVKHLDLLTASG
jgi:hypothetical protein